MGGGGGEVVVLLGAVSASVHGLLHIVEAFSNELVDLEELGCATVNAHRLPLAQIRVVVRRRNTLEIACLCQPIRM